MEPVAGIIVGSVDVGDSDRIVRVLTAEHGRISMMVRRARSSRKRWGGLIEVGNLLTLQLKKGRGDLFMLNGADLLSAPRKARADLVRIAMLAYGCELCAALAPDTHPAPKLTRLLLTWLKLLEAEAMPGMASRVALDGKALTFAGLTPSLIRCARCGLPLDGGCTWDPEAGGAQHDHCGGGGQIPSSVLAQFETLRRTPLAETTNVDAPPARWCGILTDFAQHHLRRPIKSRNLLEELS